MASSVGGLGGDGHRPGTATIVQGMIATALPRKRVYKLGFWGIMFVTDEEWRLRRVLFAKCKERNEGEQRDRPLIRWQVRPRGYW